MPIEHTSNLNQYKNNSYPTYLVLNHLTKAAYCAHETETGEKVFVMEKLLLGPDYMSRAGLSSPGSQHVC